MGLKKLGPAPVMLAIVLAYAICFTFIKFGLAYAPPLLFAGLRALVGGLIILAVLPWFRVRIWPARAWWPSIGLVALIATTINYAAMFLSPIFTGAGVASILGNIQPLFLIGLAAVFVGESISRQSWLALGLGIVGVIIMTPIATGEEGIAIGAALALAASASAAVGSILMKRVGREAVLVVTAWQFIIGSLPLLGLSAITESISLSTQLNWSFVALLLSLALFGTAFGTLAWFVMIQRYEIGRLSFYFFLVPVVGLAIALLAGEKLVAREWLGAAVIVSAVFISMIKEKKLSV